MITELTAIQSFQVKTKVQAEARQALKKAHGNGLILMATGAGKSKIGVDEIIAHEKEWGGVEALIVVPTEKLRDEGWKNEFQKWGSLSLWETSVEKVCYASLSKIEGKKYDIVILDECHNITPNNSEFFKKNKVFSLIGLTATYPRDREKAEILAGLGLNTVYELTLDNAVGLGLVAPYDITIVRVPLNAYDKTVEAGSKLKPFMTTEFKQYEYLTRLYLAAPNKMNALRRMRFIYNLKSKEAAAMWLLHNCIPKEERTLIFAGSIAQAEILEPHSYHSKTNSYWFDKFVEGEITRLSCVAALNEGHNIPDLECGLIVQANSNELHLIQRIGRHIRYRPGHIGKIILLCADETVDGTWVAKATNGFDTANITWVSLDELKSGTKTITF